MYLHVDVENFAAYSLYKRAGFEVIDSRNNRMYAEFTRKLNLHDGATRGRNHHLMHKKVSRQQTWYNGISSRRQGKLGFDLWDFQYK